MIFLLTSTDLSTFLWKLILRCISGLPPTSPLTFVVYVTIFLCVLLFFRNHVVRSQASRTIFRQACLRRLRI